MIFIAALEVVITDTTLWLHTLILGDSLRIEVLAHSGLRREGIL